MRAFGAHAPRVTVGNEEVTRLDDGTVGRPRALLPERRCNFLSGYFSPRAVRAIAWPALCSPDTMGSRTQTCKMARPAVATQTPSTLAAATATGSHMPAMVSRRDVPAISHGLAIASDALAWPANNSDNAAPRAHSRNAPSDTAAVFRSSDGIASESSLAYGRSIFTLWRNRPAIPISLIQKSAFRIIGDRWILGGQVRVYEEKRKFVIACNT